MKSNGWKHKPKTKLVVGTETNPTKLESGQVVINKKATKQNLDRLIEINNDGLDKPIKKEVTTDGTEGGLLKGKPHYDKNGNSLGGIPAVVDGAKNIETEGEEFLLNKEASQKHWKELSKINQSAGNGVPINPSDVGADEDPEEFRDGGTAKIEFNPNHIPSKWIYSYAKKIKEKYPKVWDMGGNIFGNEAFNNLERVLKRGYWTDNEEWMYIKWRSYVARHHKDFRIAGTVAMLKWVDKTDKGWDYMKDLIDKEIAKKYPKKGFKTKMKKGGEIPKCDISLTTTQKFIVDGEIQLKEIYENDNKDCTLQLLYTDKTKDLFQIAGLFVNKYKRKKGLGSQLISFSKNRASELGFSEILYLVADYNGKEYKDLVSFCKNNGFKFVGGSKRRMIFKINEMAKGGEIIKRADGSYSKRGLWDNIRANIGSGKKPTKEMLEQEAKIRSKMQTGGMMEGQPPANFENVLYRQLANRYEYGGLTTTDNIKVSGFNHYQKTKKSGKFYRLYGKKHINNDEVEIWWIFFTIKDGVKDLGTIRYRFENEKKDIYKEMVIYFNDLPNSLKEVYNNISETYKEGGLIAPNGKPSNLTPEQYRLVRTPAFKAWFGDWENSPQTASKVVDENGEPLICYHGTASNFNVFEIGRTGGIFFTNNKNSAERFSSGDLKRQGENSKILQCFLNIRKYYDKNTNDEILIDNYYKQYFEDRPFISKSSQKNILKDKYKKYFMDLVTFGIINEEPKDKLLSYKYDGIIIDADNNSKSYIIFESTQIKLADGTNTTFDGNNPDIRYKDGGTTDDFDWESLFNPSEEEEENIRQEIKKQEEQEREEEYQKSNYSKRWASTFKEAVEKTVQSYLDAKATYEDWGSRQYKSNKGVVFAGGDDIHGNAYTIGGINEYRRKRTMAGAKMQMDEELETLKKLGLSQQEIADLTENKMKDGGNVEDEKKKLKLEILKLTSKAFKQFSGSPNQNKTMNEISKLREQLDKLGGTFENGGKTESHEDLESRIMKQQFGI